MHLMGADDVALGLGKITRYPLPVPELLESKPELPKPEVPDPKFR
jgi:hypothetical protein